jgi:pimeloyl-ACP methyl ester carboxylesterase
MHSHTDMLSAFTSNRKHVWWLLLTIVLVMVALPARAVERWQTLPPTPAPIPSKHGGYVNANGISIYYAMYGQGSPVILLHGGLANSDWWGNQIPALATHHTVMVMDSRGHGRSTRDAQPYSYDLMADDVVALFDALKLRKTDVVGWSDGGIIGIDLAIRHPDRVGKIVAFGANTMTSGTRDDTDKNPTFLSALARAEKQYPIYSATPKEYQAFFDQISKMWADQPNWTDA